MAFISLDTAKDLTGAFQRGQTVFPNLTLREANLAGAHLPFIHLEGANLPQANLRNACLPGAQLCGAVLDQASLEHANLLGADLVKASLVQANLDYALLGSANLEGANLNSTSLMATSLSNAILRGANLRNANLMGANLIGADLRQANLFGAKIILSALKEAYLQDTILPDGTPCTNNDLSLKKQEAQSQPARAQAGDKFDAELGQTELWAAAQRELLIHRLVGKPEEDRVATHDRFIFYRHSPTDANTVYAFRVEPNSMDLTLCAVRKNSPVWAALTAAPGSQPQ